jgi:hypothetical protein
MNDGAPDARRLARLGSQLSTPPPTAVTTAAAPASSPTPSELRAFEQDGVLVLRRFFSEEEVDQMAAPVAELQRGAGSPLRPEQAGGSVTAKKFNFPDFRALESCPELAAASLDHPRVVAAAEQLLGGGDGGGGAELQQYGVLTWRPGAEGFSSHYDYKPTRVVGSSVHWVFAVIPLTDYAEHDGPLLVSPGSAAQTRVLPRRPPARVHCVDAAQVPGPAAVGALDPAEALLVNPQLRRGDLLFTSCFTFHAADANAPPSLGRTGIYIKYRAATAPAATGPLLFRSSVAERLVHKRLMPHHRRDGTQRVDSSALVLEEWGASGRVWAVPSAGHTGEVRWRLPRFDITPTPQMTALTTAAWDASNVIGEVLAQLERQPSAALFRPDRWLSWITDVKKESRCSGGEHLTRIYGHALSAAAMARATPGDNGEGSGADGVGGQFVELEALACTEEAAWVQMWLLSVDAHGRAVRRGVGMPVDTPDMGYNHGGRPAMNSDGELYVPQVSAGSYRVGQFEEEHGLPRRNPLASC